MIITGALGFIGSNAVRYFYNLGSDITAVVYKSVTQNQITERLGEVGKKIHIVKRDLLLPLDDLEGVEKQDVLLNFAAVDGGLAYKKAYTADLFSNNLKICLNVLDYAARNKINKVLLVSSSEIYSSRTEEITENSQIGISWDYDTDGYRLAKWTSEFAAREYYNQYGLSTIIIRPANIYGPNDEFDDEKRMRFIPTIIKRLMVENKDVVIWGSGKQKRSFLYVEDFLEACRLLMEKNIILKPVNIASKNAVSLSDVSKMIINILGSERGIVIDSTKPEGASCRMFDTKLLESLTGFKEKIGLEEGLKKTIEYYQKKYC